MTFHCDREEFGMASISERESREVEAANAFGTTPVVFIHGLFRVQRVGTQEPGYAAALPYVP
jgi:hypothetical protein